MPQCFAKAKQAWAGGYNNPRNAANFVVAAVSAAALNFKTRDGINPSRVFEFLILETGAVDQWRRLLES